MKRIGENQLVIIEAGKKGGAMKPIIRNAEEAAYILQIAPQAFREQAKRGMNRYSRVASGKRKRTYEFYPYKAAEDLNVPIEYLEARSSKYEREKGR